MNTFQIDYDLRAHRQANADAAYDQMSGLIAETE